MKIKIDNSSNIAAIDYSLDDKELSVWFKHSEEVYVYQEVEPKLWLDFLDSESKGKFIHSEIKGKYEFEKRSE